LDEVLGIKGHQLSSLSDAKLSEAIYTIAQYVSFLQVQYNIRKIIASEADWAYEMALAKELTKVEGKTLKERTTQALLSSVNLQKLEQEQRIAKADRDVFEKVPESISDLGNAFKKEVFTRQNKKFSGERN
jgi:hypothetical protein